MTPFEIVIIDGLSLKNNSTNWNMDIEIYSKIELCFNICLLEKHYNRN